VSFLRKQESRLICAWYGVAGEHQGTKATWTPPTFWIPAFAGMTPFRWLPFRFSGLLRGCPENRISPIRRVPSWNRGIIGTPCFCRVFATSWRSLPCRPPPEFANFGTASEGRGRGGLLHSAKELHRVQFTRRCLLFRRPRTRKAEQPHRLDYFQKGRILLRAEDFLTPEGSSSGSEDFSGGAAKAAASSTMAWVMAAFGACWSRGTPLFRAAIMVR